MKRLYIFHLLSCLGIADANYYYRGMAERGWMLEKARMGFDCFVKQENIEAEKLAVFPIGLTELSKEDEKMAELKLVAANKSYHIYLGKPTVFKELFTREHFASIFNWDFIWELTALLLTYPLACYWLLRTFSFLPVQIQQWLKPLSIGTIGIIEIGILWNCIRDFLEFRHIKTQNRLWERNPLRCKISVVLTYLANLVLICILFYDIILIWS